ncbi:cytochrome C biogenesis protein ResB [Candidatus Magnetomorum sp. HK-1]|nr:cytochrome C biogenesis protein ResB [Candidatus Magnetomorum sp. HK-1]
MKKLFQGNSLTLFFSSVKLSVFLLLTLAFVSIIGTVIPQEQSLAYYKSAYGEFWGTMINITGIADTYHSLWYRLLMGLLCINIIVCSFDRLMATWSIIFPKNYSARPSRFQNRKDRKAFDVMETLALVRTSISEHLSKKLSHCELKTTENGFYFYGEKGRKSRLGVYAVHTSVLLMIIGGIIGSFWGFDGHVQIPEGQSVNQLVIGQHQIIDLPFSIKCEDFSVSFYDTGAPSEFKSVLTLTRNDEKILTRSIVVNQPLRFEGINIYQSSYGLMTPEYREDLPETVVFHFENPETHLSYPIKAKQNERTALPEGQGFFKIQEYKPEYAFAGHNMGPTLILSLEVKKNGSNDSELNTQMIMLPLQYQHFDRMRKGHFIISIMNGKDFLIPETQKRYYTGLQVTNDPGVWFVYAGFILMLLGIPVTFFMSHQQYFIEVFEKSPGSCQVIISGVSNKNKYDMKQKIDRLDRDLKKVCVR